MTYKRYLEIKRKEEKLSTIARLKFLSEEIELEELKDYFNYKRFLEFQREWLGL